MPICPDAERVFPGAKYTTSDRKAKLKSTTIELLDCLKSWFRLGLFTEEDLHTVIGTIDHTATSQDVRAEPLLH